MTDCVMQQIFCHVPSMNPRGTGTYAGNVRAAGSPYAACVEMLEKMYPRRYQQGWSDDVVQPPCRRIGPLVCHLDNSHFARKFLMTYCIVRDEYLEYHVNVEWGCAHCNRRCMLTYNRVDVRDDGLVSGYIESQGHVTLLGVETPVLRKETPHLQEYFGMSDDVGSDEEYALVTDPDEDDDDDEDWDDDSSAAMDTDEDDAAHEQPEMEYWTLGEEDMVF